MTWNTNCLEQGLLCAAVCGFPMFPQCGNTTLVVIKIAAIIPLWRILVSKFEIDLPFKIQRTELCDYNRAITEFGQ